MIIRQGLIQFPLYEYECSKCNHTVERLHKASEQPKVKCDRCNTDMKKLIGTPRFNLRGDGFYKGGDNQ